MAVMDFIVIIVISWAAAVALGHDLLEFPVDPYGNSRSILKEIPGRSL
jgi:hypothetical protein